MSPTVIRMHHIAYKGIATEITPLFANKVQYSLFLFFFFNDPATPEIYPLPLHAALPISAPGSKSLTRLSSPPAGSPRLPVYPHGMGTTSMLVVLAPYTSYAYRASTTALASITP